MNSFRILKIQPLQLLFRKSTYAEMHTSSVLGIKEIIEKKEGDVTIIDAVIKKSGREDKLIKTEHDKYACPVCRLDLDIKHTDVLILSQFVRTDGCMLPRRVTGLCKNSQKRISILVSMAHVAGLMPNLVPAYSKKDCTKRRRDWKKYNTYFDDEKLRFCDPLRLDPHGLKDKFYKSMGVVRDEEPWKKRKELDISVHKLLYY